MKGAKEPSSTITGNSFSTYVDVQELLICICDGLYDIAGELLVIEEQLFCIGSLIQSNMIAIQSTCTVVMVPPFGESFGNLIPFFRSFWALKHLWFVYVNYGLADFRYGSTDGGFEDPETVLQTRT